MRRFAVPDVAGRLFFTVWLVYVLHAGTNVVRETYLAIALVDRHSVRVDDYLGLNPDLFVIDGRGAFINNNPGASIMAAVPYAVARPLFDVLFRLNPELVRPKPPASYDDPRPNRTRFMNEARARGLDVKLALAALAIQAGLMAPLGALAAATLLLFLRARLGDERQATWLALLYAFGTPIFFRSAYLNQNAIIAHCVLWAYVLAVGLAPTRVGESTPPWRLWGAGGLLGLAVLCDYSSVPILFVFGAWVVVVAATSQGPKRALHASGWFVLGAAGPIAVLLAYQWVAFGNPFLPAQAYMPATPYSVRGWYGMAWPSPDLLWRNVFDPAYGLFVFCPMLVAAFSAPLLRWRPESPSRAELVLIFAVFGVLYLFSSANQFAALQWNTGVRYLVPATPLLFCALAPVLLRLPRAVMYFVVVPTVAISWSVAMVRETVPVSLGRVLLGGFELPWLSVLRKTASAYAPFLENGTSPVPIFCLVAGILWLVWRQGNRGSQRSLPAPISHGEFGKRAPMKSH